jgi:hypothetical protein
MNLFLKLKINYLLLCDNNTKALHVIHMCLQIGMILCNEIIELTMIYVLLVGLAFVVHLKMHFIVL